MNNKKTTWNGYEISSEEEAILNKQSIQQMAGFLPTGAFSQSLMPAIFYFVFYDSSDTTLLTAWLVANLIIAVISGTLHFIFKNNPERLSDHQWFNIITLYSFVRSIVLGSIIFVIPMWVHSYTYIVITALTVFISVGVVALARNSLAFILYLLPMLILPAIAIFIYWEDEIKLVALAYMALFFPAYIAFKSTTKSTAGNLVFHLRNKSLSKKLANEKREAEQARDIAEKTNLSKSRFFAAASHDLRQPLYALSLFSRQLGKKDLGKDEALLHSQIETSISTLTTMLDSLLDVTQLDSKNIKPTATVFPISELFTNIESELCIIAEEKGIDFHIQKTNACTNTDPIQLERMIRNIVHNAIRYTEHGKIVVGVRHRRSCYEIQILDTGIGIDKQYQEMIFDEFYQIDNPERNREKGVGLGLSIVKRLSSLLNHRVTISSIPGSGSCFTITVPKAVCQSHAITPQEDQAFNLNGVIALVIDDDEKILQGISSLLEEWQVTVFSASSGNEAEAILDREGILPDVIVCDYRLRDNELGTQLISQLREIVDHQIPAILLTGDPLASIEALQTLSNVEIIYKPANHQRLYQVISAMTLPQDKLSQLDS